MPGCPRRAGCSHDHARHRNRRRRNDAGKIGARRPWPSRALRRRFGGELPWAQMRMRQYRVRRSGSCGPILAMDTTRNTGIRPIQPGQCRATSFQALFAAAGNEDAVARAVRQHGLNISAANAVAMIHAYDPEVVVFGRRVLQSADAIVPFVREYVGGRFHDYLNISRPPERTEILAASFAANCRPLRSKPGIFRAGKYKPTSLVCALSVVRDEVTR